jgi:hypothetical protein
MSAKAATRKMSAPIDGVREIHDDLKKEAFSEVGPLTAIETRPASPTAATSIRESNDNILSARKPSASNSQGGSERISGDGGSTGSKDSSGSEKRNKIKKLRWKAWILLIVSEIVLGLLAMGQILSFRSFVLDAATTNAKTELQFLHLQFSDTFLRHILGVQTLAGLPQVQSFFLHGNGEIGQEREAVLDLIRTQATIRKLHYLTFLDIRGNIIIGANTNRTGEYWNPGQVIDTLSSTNNASYVMTTDVLTLAQLHQESPPEYFDGRLSYKAKQHMRRTGTDGLVQYIATPVNVNSTLKGYIIAGHVISGDTILLENSVELFGTGFGAIIFKDSTGKPCNAIELLIDRGLQYYEDSLSESDKADMLNTAFASSDEVHVKFITIRDVNHVVAYRRTQRTQISSEAFTSQQTPGVLIVGHPLKDVDLVHQEVISTTLAFVTACLIVDVIGMLVSVRLFIDPLERLQNYVKLKVYKKYESLLREISLNQRYMIRVIIFSLLSVVFLILMITYNSKSLSKIFQLESQSALELKLLEYSYSIGPVRNVTFSQKCSFNLRVILELGAVHNCL